MSTRNLAVDNAGVSRYVHSGNLQAEIDDLAQPLIEQKITPGMVVGVLLPDGSTQFYGYGVISKDSDLKPDADTVFPVGSLSKSFLGGLITLLIDEGVFSWDDTLTELLPANTPLSSDAAKITLLQLATHTSGLPRQPINTRTFIYFVRYLFTGKSFYSHFDHDYIFDYLATFKTPDEIDFQYSNIGYGLLGHIIELRTGQPLETLLEKKILAPLGLKNTAYDPAALSAQLRHARGYAGDQPKLVPRGKPVPDWQFTELIKGASAIHSTARDILTFAAAHINRKPTPLGKALNETTQVRFPKTGTSPAIAWVVDNIDGQQITYQVGFVAGFSSYVGIDVNERTAVVVLQNSFNWDDKVGHKLLIMLHRAQQIRQSASLPKRPFSPD
jgi:CubicO group peptidase (beta-lactamase class C family)